MRVPSIGGHTVRPPGLKFGTETPIHLQIAQPKFQPLEPASPKNGVTGSVQPKTYVVYPGLDVAAGWGFAADLGGVLILLRVLKLHQAKQSSL